MEHVLGSQKEHSLASVHQVSIRSQGFPGDKSVILGWKLCQKTVSSAFTLTNEGSQRWLFSEKSNEMNLISKKHNIFDVQIIPPSLGQQASALIFNLMENSFSYQTLMLYTGWK